jgi:hypothetical protein
VKDCNPLAHGSAEGDGGGSHGGHAAVGADGRAGTPGRWTGLCTGCHQLNRVLTHNNNVVQRAVSTLPDGRPVPACWAQVRLLHHSRVSDFRLVTSTILSVIIECVFRLQNNVSEKCQP